ncbi:hypothetical protein ABZ816_39605 [Actinosynnema sp. NPDC047251]|uniref:hypothetical protein n=1 Tax=Saccharothrix espanaensis TaxID=103731 RepID=UPI00059DBA08|nr:hypothetical protein [Saccharothrix espanaensis]
MMMKAEVLPARAAYLIREGSVDGLRRVVREASTRWGGVAEPVVPVRPDGEVDGWWRQVVATSAVEGLVDVDAGTDRARRVSESFGLPVTTLADIDRSGPTRFTVHPLSLNDRGGPDGQAPVVCCVDGPLWQAVLAGDFTAEHEQEHGDLIGHRRPRTGDEVARAALWGGTFLDRTGDSFGENHAAGAWPVPALVWVVGEDEFRDCLWFWNMRALSSRRFEPCPMVLVPAAGVEHWVGFGRDLAGQLSRLDEFAPDVVVSSVSVPEDVLHGLAEHVLELHPTGEKLRTGVSSSAKPRVPPFTYRVNLEIRDLLIFSRRYGQVEEREVFATDGRVQLRTPSPVAFNGAGRVLLRLTSPLFDGLPVRDVLAGKIVDNAVWRDRSVQIATNTMGVHPLNLAVPSLGDATDVLIGEKTSTWGLSEKGRLAAALTDGTDLSVLLRPTVYEAVVHLTTPRATAYRREMEKMRSNGMSDEEIDEFAARWGGRGERRYDSAAGLVERIGQLAVDPVDALETLCSIGWAERGFEADCARCGVRSFVPLPAAETAAKCPGCRATATYTKTTYSVALHYRLNTLVDRASDQGVVPHLLVIAALTRRSAQTHLLGGALATFHDGTNREIDVVGIHDQRYIAGEVKSKARDFTSEQLDRDFDTSARLGVDTHLIAAVDTIPTDLELSAHARAQAAGLDLINLSKEQLRPTQ